MSQMESTAPTSWKWTFSMLTPWACGFGFAEDLKDALGWRL